VTRGEQDDVGRTRPTLITLSRDECLELLGSAVIGRVVVPIGAAGRPVIRPVNYAFDTVSQSVVFRSAAGGKLYALLHAAQAWFEVDAFEPANRTGWSVIIQGVTEPVTDPMEVRRLERLRLHSWVTGTSGQLMRIRARTVSGRRIEAGEPG
jgi:nitroimidazol reductase NimA-like FMN-containing flavoprotein (pyridoxamine 5'-phosphate oxidase superfamily)